MSILDRAPELGALLCDVEKPARYTGGEYGAVFKDLENVDTRFAFCFPDAYEIGMSHLGLRILVGLLNNMDGVWCERAFAPWTDMEELMRSKNIPLYALESGDPLNEFDIVGFTLQYELCYTNVLNMLDMGGIPLRAADRGEHDPLVVGGGPCAYNPEPVAEFFDLFMLGEGEEVMPELVNAYRAAKKAGKTRREFLAEASHIGGVYVPSMYSVAYFDDGRVSAITPLDGAPEKITKRIVTDLDTMYFPDSFAVPSTTVVHDRVMTEVFRGCIRGCRFCQAGYTWRPVRAKKPETIIEQARKQLEFTGCEEVSLTSLSTSDYAELETLCDGLLDFCEPKSISLSLPSLRADSFSKELLEKVQKVRKSGLTFAPEAGTQRLRDVINKNITEESILNACALAFSGGWNNVKLYFMLGLPTETEDDIAGIAEMSEHVLYTWRKNAKIKDRGARITVSTSTFVPKPFTPFQWAAQDSQEMMQKKVEFLRSNIKAKSVTYNWHEPRCSRLEGIMARGDRRLSAAILLAWQKGCRFDSWDQKMRFDLWMEAMDECALDGDFYASRERAADEIFPWEHLDVGVDKSYFYQSWLDALAGRPAPDCRELCTGCGASRLDARCAAAPRENVNHN